MATNAEKAAWEAHLQNVSKREDKRVAQQRINDQLARRLNDASKEALISVLWRALDDGRMTKKNIDDEFAHIHGPEWVRKHKRLDHEADEPLPLSEPEKKMILVQRGKLPNDQYNGEAQPGWKRGRYDSNKLSANLNRNGLEELYHDWECLRCNEKGGWACLYHPGVLRSVKAVHLQHGHTIFYKYEQVWNCCEKPEKMVGCKKESVHLYLKDDSISSVRYPLGMGISELVRARQMDEEMKRKTAENNPGPTMYTVAILTSEIRASVNQDDRKIHGPPLDTAMRFAATVRLDCTDEPTNKEQDIKSKYAGGKQAVMANRGPSWDNEATRLAMEDELVAEAIKRSLEDEEHRERIRKHTPHVADPISAVYKLDEIKEVQLVEARGNSSFKCKKPSTEGEGQKPLLTLNPKARLSHKVIREEVPGIAMPSSPSWGLESSKWRKDIVEPTIEERHGRDLDRIPTYGQRTWGSTSGLIESSSTWAEQKDDEPPKKRKRSGTSVGLDHSKESLSEG